MLTVAGRTVELNAELLKQQFRRPMTVPVSAARRRGGHRRAAPRHRARDGLDLLAVGLDRFDAGPRRGPGRGRRRRRGRSRPCAASTARARPSSPAGWPSGPSAAGFATAEVQISETETPLHRLETVYRRLSEQLRHRRVPAERAPAGARRAGSSRWRRTSSPPAPVAEDDAAARRGGRRAAGAAARRQSPARTPGVRRGAARLPRPRCGRRRSRPPTALAAWLGGQPHVAAAAKPRRRRPGRPRPLRRAGLPAGPADGAARLRPPRAAARARRGRDPAAGPRRRPGQGAQRAAAAHRRGRRRPLPRAVPRHHRHAGVLRRASRACSGCRRWRSGWPPTSPPIPRFDNPRAVQLRLPGFDRRRAGRARRPRSATCTPPAPTTPDRIATVVDDAYVGDLARARRPGSSAARSASRRGCS